MLRIVVVFRVGGDWERRATQRWPGNDVIVLWHQRSNRTRRCRMSISVSVETSLCGRFPNTQVVFCQRGTPEGLCLVSDQRLHLSQPHSNSVCGLMWRTLWWAELTAERLSDWHIKALFIARCGELGWTCHRVSSQTVPSPEMNSVEGISWSGTQSHLPLNSRICTGGLIRLTDSPAFTAGWWATLKMKSKNTFCSLVSSKAHEYYMYFPIHSLRRGTILWVNLLCGWQRRRWGCWSS